MLELKQSAAVERIVWPGQIHCSRVATVLDSSTRILSLRKARTTKAGSRALRACEAETRSCLIGPLCAHEDLARIRHSCIKHMRLDLSGLAAR